MERASDFLVSASTDDSRILPRVAIVQPRRIARVHTLPPLPRGVGDYQDKGFVREATPATGVYRPLGPVNFPTVSKSPPTTNELLQNIAGQNDTRRPILRAAAIDANGQTLDWSALGQMARILIRNKGPNSVWIAFDVNGPSVDAFTSNLSFELQAQESLNIPLCSFYKIGCKCAAGQTGTVHAVALEANAGNFAGAIA